MVDVPIEVFTFGSDIAHAIASLSLPLFTSGFLLMSTHDWDLLWS